MRGRLRAMSRDRHLRGCILGNQHLHLARHSFDIVSSATKARTSSMYVRASLVCRLDPETKYQVREYERDRSHHQRTYCSPLLQHEVFEEPDPGLGIHSADLLQCGGLIFCLSSTLCGTMRVNNCGIPPRTFVRCIPNAKAKNGAWH